MEKQIRTSATLQCVLKLSGMTCTSCANHIATDLNKLNGVRSANVNFATEKAYVEFDPQLVTPEQLVECVQNAGYDATIAETEGGNAKVTRTYKISGMSCSSCANTIEKALSRLPGVERANVSFASEKATVTFNPEQVRVTDLKRIVTNTGYQLTEEVEQTKDADDLKMRSALRTMLISAGLSTVIMVLMVIHMFVRPVPGYLPLTAILGFPIIFGTGLHVHQASIKALRNGRANMDVLVTLGSLPPYLVGLLGFFIPVQTFIEMATTIMTFHLVGKYLETRAKGRASQAIKKLVQMGAKTARVIENGKEQEVAVEDLRIGDIMVVRPGEKIPTDGTIVAGTSLIDESMATGESMPVQRAPGDAVIGATINRQGLLQVEVTKVGKDTFLSQVIKMVEECQGSKVPIQEFADRITGYFVPAIVVLTILTFISFNLFPSFHLGIIEWGASFLPWVNPALTPLTLAFITATAVLVIACPCALGLGTPTALMVGSGLGAEHGILIRNGEAVQTLKEVRLVAFDKTGTITKGKPEVTDLLTLSEHSNQELLYYAASVEAGSEHPLSHAITVAAEADKLKLGTLTDFQAVVGMGVSGTVDGLSVLVGSKRLMQEQGVEYMTGQAQLERLEDQAKTAMYVAVDGRLAGIIAVADTLKADSALAIKELESLGIKTAMITGDNERTAKAIAAQVGISHVIAGVLPDGKVNEIVKLQEQYGTIAMVGDGINDAPALKQSNVGIAIGTGTDIAIEAADVTLVRGDISGIISAIKLSRSIFRKIQENYFWAWFYNAVAIPVATLGLLHPMIGVAAMSMSSLNVVYNSLRLRKVDIRPSFARN